jgi:DNA-binding CsgD family transcriptional regulator
MHGIPETSWRKINDFLLSLETARSKKDLNAKVLAEISGLVPFENSGNLIEIDSNYRSTIRSSIQADRKWQELFNNHFYKIAAHPPFDENILSANSEYLKKNNKDEYINEFLIPQRIGFSAGFIVFNNENMPFNAFVINRSSSEKVFSQEELAMLKVIQPHLCNYHRNLEFLDKLLKMQVMPLELQKDTRLLSRRESEIIHLLFKRMRPAEIARELGISILTVRKHIYNSYEKLRVMDRQQLFEKLHMNIKAE